MVNFRILKPHPRAALRLTPPLREGSEWLELSNSSLFVLPLKEAIEFFTLRSSLKRGYRILYSSLFVLHLKEAIEFFTLHSSFFTFNSSFFTFPLILLVRDVAHLCHPIHPSVHDEGRTVGGENDLNVGVKREDQFDKTLLPFHMETHLRLVHEEDIR